VQYILKLKSMVKRLLIYVLVDYMKIVLLLEDTMGENLTGSAPPSVLHFSSAPNNYCFLRFKL
jgi:hypothetical protein